MSSAAREILRRRFGYPEFRGEQEAIIDRVAGGGDAVVLLPTGGGKSLCYQIPALLRPGTGIVVSPLISLMQDQVAALETLGIAAAFLNSSLAPDAAREVERRFLAGELDLLYVAPERLLTERFLADLDGARLALFAIDEAHCVSQWGHDFRPEYLGLAVLAERYPGVPRVALTATADPPTRREIVERLALPEARVFVASFDRPNLFYRVVDKHDGGRRQLLDFLRSRHLGHAGIVYRFSRAKVEQTAAWLAGEGFPAVAYHAGLDPLERRRGLDRFRREEGIVVVATVAFGMGIDKPDVRFVAHLDLPKSLEAYHQETGRAGRDGEPADAWMAYGLGDLVQQRALVDAGEAAPERKLVERRKLDALAAYCETTACRREVLLRYFGETLAAPCGNCDTCREPAETWDATVVAQKALSAVARTGERFGAEHLIDLLRGERTEKIERFRHDRLPTFGVGQELDPRSWRGVFRQLVARGLLASDVQGWNTFRLTERARPVLRGEERIELRREREAPKTRSRKAAAPSALAPTSAEERLFERLRAARAELARAQGVPPYVVFHDSTLRAVAAARPRTLAELGALPGIGERKLERYGERLLEVTREEATESA